MDELSIGGILLVPVIVAIVELAKKVGLPSDYAPYANAALTVVGYVGMVLLGQYPEYTEIAVHALNAVILFLTAAGFYTTASHFVEKVKK